MAPSVMSTQISLWTTTASQLGASPSVSPGVQDELHVTDHDRPPIRTAALRSAVDEESSAP